MHRMRFPVVVLVVLLMIVLMIALVVVLRAVLVIMIPFRARFSVHRVNYTGMVVVGNHVVRRYYSETQQQEDRYVLFPDQYEDIYMANIIKKPPRTFLLDLEGFRGGENMVRYGIISLPTSHPSVRTRTRPGRVHPLQRWYHRIHASI